jgi:DNA-binding NarL/FixJ family response regulator
VTEAGSARGDWDLCPWRLGTPARQALRIAHIDPEVPRMPADNIAASGGQEHVLPRREAADTLAAVAGGQSQQPVGPEPLRVLVVDDSEPFRAGLAALLASVDGIVCVGEATTGDEAIARALALHPDVVLMDLNMPGRNGIDATRAIVSSAPHIAVLALTMHDDDDSVFAALQAGARGYLVKGARQTELLRALHAVADGGAVFGPAIARRMVDFFAAAASAASAVAFPDLTAREREILHLVARGRSNAQIAQQLVLSTKTVRNHVSSVFTKIQVVDRAQAIVKAREAGIGGR